MALDHPQVWAGIENWDSISCSGFDGCDKQVENPFLQNVLFACLLTGLCQGPQQIYKIAGYKVLLQSLLPGSLHSLDPQSRFDASLRLETPVVER